MVQNPGKHAPFPLIPGVRTAQPLDVPPSKSTRGLLPTSPNPGRPQGHSACTSLLEERGLLPALSPPLGPFPAPGSGFTHRCPELLRFARAGSRRSSLARPSPAPAGKEGGLPGRGSSARAPLVSPAPPPRSLVAAHCGVLSTPFHSSRDSLASLFRGRFGSVSGLDLSTVPPLALRPQEVSVNYRTAPTLSEGVLVQLRKGKARAGP